MVIQLRTAVRPSKKGTSLLVDMIEGFSTYKVVIPMPYAIDFFLEGLVESLALLNQHKENGSKLAARVGQKAEIQDRLAQAIQLYEQFLSKSGR